MKLIDKLIYFPTLLIPMEANSIQLMWNGKSIDSLTFGPQGTVNILCCDSVTPHVRNQRPGRLSCCAAWPFSQHCVRLTFASYWKYFCLQDSEQYFSTLVLTRRQVNFINLLVITCSLFCLKYKMILQSFSEGREVIKLVVKNRRVRWPDNSVSRRYWQGRLTF